MSTIIPKVAKLSERVIRVLGCNPGPFTLQGTNTYLIGQGTNRVLLDTGDNGHRDDYIKLLNDVLESNKVKLSNIIITHWHHDHIGGLEDVLSLPGSSGCKINKVKDDQHDPKTFPFDYLEDEQKISVDGSTLRIYYTPGHTKDHIVVYLDEEKTLFSGDCILGEASAVFEDLRDYLKSLERIMSLKMDKIYPGHGPEISEPIGKIKEYIDHRMAREKQIIDCIAVAGSQGITIENLVSIIYKDTPKHLHQAAAFNVSHHLEKLLKDDQISSSTSSGEVHYWLKDKENQS